MDSNKIACMRCIHYQVTFDPAAPRGCKIYKFKSVTMPSVLVKQSSGSDCQSFQIRVKSQEESSEEKKDFNDPKYWG